MDAAEVEIELVEIEKALPLQALVVFRKIAALEIKREAKREAAEQAAAAAAAGAAAAKSSWSSWFTGKSAPTTSQSTTSKEALLKEREEDEFLMAQILEQYTVVNPLGGAVGAIDQDVMSLRLRVTSQAVVAISSDGRPLSRMELAMQAAVEVKSSSTSVNFAINDIWMTDEFTQNPLRKDIVRSQQRSANGKRTERVSGRSSAAVAESGGVAVGSGRLLPLSPLSATAAGGPAAGPAQCTVVFDTSEAGTMIQIHSAPLEITWNEDCIHELLNIFLSGPKADLLANARIMER